MPSGFDKETIDSFFDTDGVATGALITGTGFIRTIPVILDIDTHEVGLYPETDVVASKPSFLAKSTDLAGVKPRMQVTFPDLEPHEDGYGGTFEITPRIVAEGVQTSRIYLKEL